MNKFVRYIGFMSAALFLCTAALVAPKEAHASGLVRPANNLGLVGYWSFEDASGTQATDFSGNGNTGTLNGGTTWVNGKRGKALTFDGLVHTRVNINGVVDDIATGDVTVSAWINFAADYTSSSACATIFRLGDDPSDNDIDFMFGLSDSSDSASGTLHIAAYNGGWPTASTSQSTWTAGRWYHVVGTVVSGGALAVYVDGVQVGTSTMGGARGSTYSTLAKLGETTNNGPQCYFPGTIDEARIYNRALSQAEVAALYNSNSSRVTAPNNNGLVGYWSMEDATGTQATDFSGNGYTGTLTNMESSDWVDGKRGKALNFDGSEYIPASGAAVPMRSANTLTISFWAKATSNTLNPVAVSLNTDGDADDSLLIYPFDTFGGNGARVYYNEGQSIINENTIDRADGNWHHFVYVQNGATSHTLYADGSSIGADSTSLTLDSGLNQFNIGAWKAGSQFFIGSLDEVRLYSRALTPAEVTALYNAGASVASAPDNRGLVGYWSLNDGTSTQATDFSGNGKTGTLNGNAAWITGKQSKALTFDGTGDYVSASAAVTDFPITMAAWVKLAATSTGQSVMSLGDNSGTYYVDLRVSTVMQALTKNVNPDSVNGSTSLLPGVWYHMAATYTSTSLQVFLNGAADSTLSGNANATTTITETKIGRLSGFDSLDFNGQIDEIRIYNRALSADEILKLYNSR